MWWTVGLTIASITTGGALGVFVFLARRVRLSPVHWLAVVFIEVFRGLPVLVTLIWLFFCLPLLLGSAGQMPPFWVAVLGLGLNYAALQAEILRAGYEAIPPGEIEAALGLRFSRWQILRYIAIPQAFWRSLAPTLGQAINTLKLTALASFIAVPELFYSASDLIKATSRPLEFYSILAAVYLALILPLSFVLEAMEARLTARFHHV